MAFQFLEVVVKKEKKKPKLVQIEKTYLGEQTGQQSPFWQPETQQQHPVSPAPHKASSQETSAKQEASTLPPKPVQEKAARKPSQPEYEKEQRIRQEFPTARRIGNAEEKELVYTRSTLGEAKRVGNEYRVEGWVRFINPNNKPKKVKLWAEVDYAVEIGPNTITWRSIKAGKICVCGECGETVELELPPDSDKKCDVSIEVPIPELKGKIEEVDIALKMYYKHPKKIPGMGWVEGGTMKTVSAVMVYPSY